MNSAQHAAMELLAKMAKPDVAEAERCLELSQSLELPPRVTGEIQEYIELARGAGNMAHAAKLANERATKCWQAVKEQASRVDDLVDMAQSATKAAEVVHATTAVDGAPEAAVDETADPIGDLVRSTVPAAASFFCRGWSDMDELKAFLAELPVASNDETACSLMVLLLASSELVKHGMVENTAPMIVAVLSECLQACDERKYLQDPARNLELFRQTVKKAKVDARRFLAAIAPRVLDLFDGMMPTDKATLAELSLASLASSYWDGSLCVPSRSAAIAAEIGRRENATPTDQPGKPTSGRTEPLRGLERAAQEGRRNWNLEGKHSTSYNKPSYREAYERGWNDCQRAYEQGRADSRDFDGPNPYLDADPDGALARAYDAGLGDGIIEDAHREAEESAAEQSMIDELEEGDDDAHAG